MHPSMQIRYGNIDGFVQIPRGGGAGTTSGERPTFAEIGFNHAAIGAPAVALGWNNHNIYGTHYQAQRLGCSQ
jgi:hypothetical protein